MSVEKRATVQGLVALALWASTVALSRSLSESLGALWAPAWALLVGGVLSLGAAALRGGAGPMLRLPPRYLVGCGALFVGYMGCLYAAIGLAADRPTTLVVGLLNYLWPAAMVALSVPLLGRQASKGLLVLGCALAFAGAAAAVVGDPSALGRLGGRSVAPLALAALAGLLWALYSNLARRFGPADGDADAVPLFLLVSGGMLAAAALATGERAQWSTRAVIELVVLASGPMALAYPLWERGVRRGDHALLGVASYFMPVASLGLAALYLGVVPDRGVGVGCALVVAGAYVTRRALR